MMQAAIIQMVIPFLRGRIFSTIHPKDCGKLFGKGRPIDWLSNKFIVAETKTPQKGENREKTPRFLVEKEKPRRKLQRGLCFGND
jgi:hypothetical protein